MHVLPVFYRKSFNPFIYLLVRWCLCEGQEQPEQYRESCENNLSPTERLVLFGKSALFKEQNIIDQHVHVLSPQFTLMPSGRCFMAPLKNKPLLKILHTVSAKHQLR